MSKRCRKREDAEKRIKCKYEIMEDEDGENEGGDWF
jgi:hypothetical protein